MGLMAYHLKKKGIMTYFWVCNSEGDIERALSYGACGIMTDNPPLLDSYLRSKAKNVCVSSTEEE